MSLSRSLIAGGLGCWLIVSLASISPERQAAMTRAAIGLQQRLMAYEAARSLAERSSFARFVCQAAIDDRVGVSREGLDKASSSWPVVAGENGSFVVTAVVSGAGGTQAEWVCVARAAFGAFEVVSLAPVAR